jgi:putative copper resistance protein D
LPGAKREERLIDPLVIARAIHFASCILVAGAAVYSILVAEPIWQRRDLRNAMPGNYQTLVARLLWPGLALAIASGVTHLVLVASDIASEAWREVISDRMAWTVLTDTQFGQFSQLRLLLALVLACLLLLSRLYGNRVANWLRIFTAGFAILLLGSLAWMGHAAGATGAGANTHLTSDILHIVAAGIWVGGLAPLALFMWRVDGSDHHQHLATSGPVLRRFSNLGVISVAVLFVSGLVNTWFLTNHLRGLIGTRYGVLLQIKLALFLGMLCIAAANRFRLLPQLVEIADPPHQPGNVVTLRQLRRNTGVEIALGLAVLYIVGLLGVTPPVGHAHQP